MTAFVLGGLALCTYRPGAGRPAPHGLRARTISLGQRGGFAAHPFDPARQRVRVLRIRHPRDAGSTDEEA